MRRILFLLIILTPLLTISQTTTNNTIFTISGKIIDSSTKLPLEDATVIFKSIDSNKIKFGGITNARGRFSIDVEEGSYNTTVEFLSYQAKKLNISTITRNLNIGTIQLELDTQFLDEIEIIGEKKALEFKANKIVFNVGKDISAAGSMATDILNNIPSVSVDPDGNVSLRGQNNVTIMINGKISSMSKPEILKSLPAGSIENIEVITSPGARYSASSGSGIINILLKKGKNEGLNASITSSGGYKDYSGGLLTLNHKSQKLNFFTTTSYSHRNPIDLASYQNEYFNNGITTSFLNENTENNRNANIFYNKVGADFFLSKRSTLTTTVNYTNIVANNSSNTITNFFDTSKKPTISNRRLNNGTFKDEIFEIEVDFEQKFKKKGQKLSTSATFTKDVETYNNNFTNSNSLFFDETTLEKNTLKNTMFDLAFFNPINENSEYNIGYHGEFGKIPFTYSSNNLNNIINYKEDIHALFLDYSKQLGKFYCQLGIRAEFFKSEIEYQSLNITQKKTFNDFFPTSYFEYNFSDTQNLSLSLGRYIFRPGYYNLQPFEQKISETFSFVGNEKLNPYYVYKIDLTYVYTNEKFTFSPSLFYNIYKNWFQIVTYETGKQINGVNKLITTPMNVGSVNYYGAVITTTFKPTKIVNFVGNILILNMDQTGIFKTINLADETIIKDYNQSIFITYFSLLTQLKIPNVFDFQINAKHDLIRKSTFSTRYPRTYISFAINKDLFNKNASISLTINDLFNSNKIDKDRFDTNYFSKSLAKNKYQTILLSFTYRFNQNKQDRKINFERKEKESKPKF